MANWRMLNVKLMGKVVIDTRIIDVKSLEFESKSLEVLGLEEEDVGKIEFNNQIIMSVHPDDDRIDVDVEIIICPENKDIQLMKSKVRSIYEIKDLSLHFDEENQSLTLPTDLINKMVETSISNTRGVLAVQALATEYSGITLPLSKIEDYQKETIKGSA